MKNNYDKNGNKLKGATVCTRTISEAGGLEKYNKQVTLSGQFEIYDTSGTGM